MLLEVARDISKKWYQIKVIKVSKSTQNTQVKMC